MDVEHLKSKADNETYDIADAEARAAITELNSNLNNFVTSTVVTGTTTTTGALSIPDELLSKPIIDVYSNDQTVPMLVFRRARNYFTCYDATLTTPAPIRNTSVSVKVWYFDTSLV